ncbi:MAG: efflux RND transporter permease subunit [Gammaproteobacteria bacterium]|nr:efflux RND transporter permease subunit [Gammaproteobacteria bacterium]MDE0248945.1 efflux RND transporter permease subunit [Gammaproteobacteria bacterium]
MDLTRYAIDNRVVTLAALAVVAFSGLSAYRNLPRAEDPGFLVRNATVRTQFPGAAPERVELLVTDPIERAIQEIPEVAHITSESRTGQSIVTVEILGSVTELRPVWDNLRRKVEDVAGELPEGVAPVVDDDLGEVFGTVVTLTADGFSYAELEEIAGQVREVFLRVEDVARVEIQGTQEERVFVDFDNARLSGLGLSAAQLQRILQSSNIIVPGGAVETGVERITLEPTGNFTSVEDIRGTLITLPGTGETVFLGDVADVRRGYAEPARERVRANGEPALVLAISMRTGGNIVGLGENIRAAIADLEQRFPLGVAFDILAFQPEVVDRAVSTFVSSILQAVGIVLLCMLLFLGLRTGLVVASLVPMAMLATLMLMQSLGIGLDKMSLASLIIALGLLVDNAIVMSESILVRMQGGEDARTAAVASSKELRIPLLVSSLTTIAAFLPIVLAESAVGEYTAPLAQVIAITLLSSWLFAITMIPLLCVIFLRVRRRGAADADGTAEEAVETRGDAFDTPFYRQYRGVLRLLLRRPGVTVAGAVGVLVATMGLFRLVEQSFFPESREVLFTGDFEFPYGTSFAYTEAAMLDIERFLIEELAAEEDREGVRNWAFFVGSGGPRFNLGYNPAQPHSGYAALIGNASAFDAVGPLIDRLREHVEANHPGVEVTLSRLASGPGAGTPVEVRLFGPDQDVLFGLADGVKAELASVPGTRNITDNWGQQTKKLVVAIDNARARRAGITNQDIAVSLRTALSGSPVTEYREGDRAIPVVLRSEVGEREDIGKLESINVYAQSGQNVALSQVADVVLTFEPSRILRRDRSKTLSVLSDLDPGSGTTAFSTAAAIDPWLAEQQAGWPLGYSYELGGTSESSAEANASIAAKLPLAGLLILLLLVGQFNSLRKPLIIVLTIPLGLTGVVIGLLLTGQSFGFMTLLGVISLAGIVINNAIVLIDRIRIEIDENGLEPGPAVLEAAQRRLRPIVLTTATTVGGLLPLWFGGDPLFVSMAVAILFGLVFATLLTLGFVPALYCLLFRVSYR